MRALLLLPLLTLAAAPAQEERRFIASGFDRLRVIGPYTVEVVPGSPGATASGDRAALDGVSVRVESGVLVIHGPAVSMTSRAAPTRLPLKLRVAATNLRGVAGFDGAVIAIADLRAQRIDLEAGDGASLSVGTLDAEELFAIVDKSAMTLAGKADHLRLNGGGDAKLTADKFTAGEAELQWEGTTPLRIGVRYSAQVANYGKGLVTVTGRPQCEVRGTGPVKCGSGAVTNAKPTRAP